MSLSPPIRGCEGRHVVPVSCSQSGQPQVGTPQWIDFSQVMWAVASPEDKQLLINIHKHKLNISSPHVSSKNFQKFEINMKRDLILTVYKKKCSAFAYLELKERCKRCCFSMLSFSETMETKILSLQSSTQNVLWTFTIKTFCKFEGAPLVHRIIPMFTVK